MRGMDYYLNTAPGLHIVRTVSDPPDWDLIRPRDPAAIRRTRPGRSRRSH